LKLGLEGRRALVTGGSAGIGRAICTALAAEGAQVGVVGRDASRLSEVLSAIREAGGEAVALAVDLRHGDGVRDLIGELQARWGGIDILINCAGAAPHVDPLEATDEQFIDAMTLKYHGYVRTCRAVAPIMIQQRSGRMLNIIGVGGVQPMSVHLPGGSANAALILFTKGFGRLLAPHNVLVNGLSPGAVRSQRSTQHYQAMAEREGISAEEARRSVLRSCPLGREAEPEEIADFAAFIVSDRCRYLVGETINLDGGLVAAT
jgi:NAD(P)-dependent dehydrogenase (short-subunit alcohol dehydrogenase family)